MISRCASDGGASEREKAAASDSLHALPMFPQHAASTTASALDQVAEFLRRTRNVPEIRQVKHFHDHPSYVGALANLVHEHWRPSGPPDKLVMRFPGPPRLSLAPGAPSPNQCPQTPH